MSKYPGASRRRAPAYMRCSTEPVVMWFATRETAPEWRDYWWSYVVLPRAGEGTNND